MSDLISRKALSERVLQEERGNDIHKDGRSKAIHHAEYRHFQKVISEMPTAFDLENVIERLEKEKENSYYEANSKGGRANGKSIVYGENLAYQKALEILKSAANATNGRMESEGMEELKKCPFCGGNASKVFDPDGTEQSDGKKWAYTVVCDRCAASTGLCWSDEQAIKAWNRRCCE